MELLNHFYLLAHSADAEERRRRRRQTASKMTPKTRPFRSSMQTNEQMNIYDNYMQKYKTKRNTEGAKYLGYVEKDRTNVDQGVYDTLFYEKYSSLYKTNERKNPETNCLAAPLEAKAGLLNRCTASETVDCDRP